MTLTSVSKKVSSSQCSAAWWQAYDESETTVDCQYLWGARTGHRDEFILRDRNTETSSDSSSESFDERLWSLMDYYDPTSAVNTEGDVVERYRFSAFGLRSIIAPDFSPRAISHYDWDFAFKGQFLEVDTGYYNYGYRYYSPELGRWLSRDPVGEKGDITVYQFCLNSAINSLDHRGLKAIKFVLGYDKTFGAPEPGYASRFEGELNGMIKKCVKKAKPFTCSIPFVKDKPAQCPDLDLKELESLTVEIRVGKHFDDKGAIGQVWGNPLTLNGQYNSADAATEASIIANLKSSNQGHFGVLLTKSQIYTMPTAINPGNRALAHSSQGGERFLIDVQSANAWSFSHEFGHVMGWKSASGSVHATDDPGNLMGPSGGPDPDCQYCRLLISHAT